MKQITEIYHFLVPARFAVLPVEMKDTLDGTTTPTVENVRVWKGKGAVVTVVNFLKGAENQMISILGDGTTTIAHNTKIKTNTGANKLLSALKVYRFTFIDSIWYEDGS